MELRLEQFFERVGRTRRVPRYAPPVREVSPGGESAGVVRAQAVEVPFRLLGERVRQAGRIRSNGMFLSYSG
ncbi:hypothetical protein [Streptomyces sp. NPDC051211]|uniref:hypothetical protein n=1 Tax=Streptomyces sp. NPDC051211 TaxID=3154643 RepID=UPI00344E6092